MAVLELRTPLTNEERLEKRRLILRDLISLLGLFAATVSLAVLTYFLFNSFTLHRQDLAQRWLARGNAALAAGEPAQAVEALRSALEYAPGRRDIEIDLAGALAAAGRTDEAIAYFNVLRETEPGDGLINLDLARLAVRKNNENEALNDYERALDGTWHGDGYLRRLSVRLELTRHLLALHDFAHARTQLLIAAGNAPDEPAVKLQIASLMEQAQDPGSAFEIYSTLAEHKPPSLDALEGAGRTAYATGHFELAHKYLDHAIAHPEFAGRPGAAQLRAMLTESNQLLALYPDPDLRVDERAQRILHAADLARARLAACSTNAAIPASQLADLATRWQPVPANLKPLTLARDPQLEQTLMRLVFDTEFRTAQACGAPTGDDALLLKIAQSPLAADQLGDREAGQQP